MSHLLFDTNSKTVSFLNEGNVSNNYYSLYSSYFKTNIDLRNVARGNRIYVLDRALRSDGKDKKEAIRLCSRIATNLSIVASNLRRIERYEDRNEPIPMNDDRLRNINLQFGGISAAQCREAAEEYQDIVDSYRR